MQTLAIFGDEASREKAIAQLLRERRSQQNAAEPASESPRPENNDEGTVECARLIADLAQKARAELQFDTMI